MLSKTPSVVHGDWAWHSNGCLMLSMGYPFVVLMEVNDFTIYKKDITYRR